MKVFFLYCAAIIFGAIFFGAQNISAYQDYTIEPRVIDAELKGRDIVTKEITITNVGTSPVTVYPSVNNVSIEEGGRIQEFLPPVMSDRTASLASWLEISRLGVDLPSGASKTITLTMRIHPTPVPGTYHAFVGFGSGGNRDEAEKMVMNGQAPGTTITVTIVEEKREFLKLAKFIVERFVTRTENQAAAFTFRNPGDEPVTPHGEIILYDSTGKEVGTLPVNEENVTLAPGEEHTFTAQVPTEGLFGKYKAYLSVEYGKIQRASVQDTHFFYVFPLKVLIGILMALMVLVAVIAWYAHARYFGDEIIDESDRLTVHVRDNHSNPKDHDINLKNTP